VLTKYSETWISAEALSHLGIRNYLVRQFERTLGGAVDKYAWQLYEKGRWGYLTPDELSQLERDYVHLVAARAIER